MQVNEIAIRPDSYFHIDDAAALVGSSRESLQREKRAGRLRIEKRGYNLFIRGQWLINWLEGETSCVAGSDGHGS